MATHLSTLTDHSISIITNDGRNIVGVLKGYDQCINVVLEDSFERVYSSKSSMEVVDLGLYIIRGDNIAIIGEVDDVMVMRKDTRHANPLKPVVH